MAAHLIVQASGAMFNTAEPQGWTFVFGIFVTDHDGKPVEGLKKNNFSIWMLTTSVSDVTVNIAMELNAQIPASKMRGIYRVQTTVVLGLQAPQPQEFVFAIRVNEVRGRRSVEGTTTVPITYLGTAH